MQWQEALGAITLLTLAFPRQTLSDETIDLYARAIEDLPAPATQAAIGRIIATSKFFPTIAEIRRAVAEDTIQAPTAAEAWAEVLEKAKGRYTPAGACSHWLVNEAARAFTCADFEDIDKTMAARAHFLQMYEELREKAITKAQASLNQPLTVKVKALADAQSTALARRGA